MYEKRTCTSKVRTTGKFWRFFVERGWIGASFAITMEKIATLRLGKKLFSLHLCQSYTWSLWSARSSTAFWLEESC